MRCLPLIEPFCHNVELGDAWRARGRERREVYLRRDGPMCKLLSWPSCQASLRRGVAWHLMNVDLEATEAAHLQLRRLNGRNGTAALPGDEAAAVGQLEACSEAGHCSHMLTTPTTGPNPMCFNGFQRYSGDFEAVIPCSRTRAPTQDTAVTPRGPRGLFFRPQAPKDGPFRKQARPTSSILPSGSKE